LEISFVGIFHYEIDIITVYETTEILDNMLGLAVIHNLDFFKDVFELSKVWSIELELFESISMFVNIRNSFKDGSIATFGNLLKLSEIREFRTRFRKKRWFMLMEVLE